jgi:hypothetical protein
VSLREEHRLRVFERRVLRRIFGLKRGEVTGEWRKLNNGKLDNLYSSPDIIRKIKSRRMRWAGHVAPWERRETCTGFWRESPKERDHLEGRRRWEDGIRMDHGEIGLGGGGGVDSPCSG